MPLDNNNNIGLFSSKMRGQSFFISVFLLFVKFQGPVYKGLQVCDCRRIPCPPIFMTEFRYLLAALLGSAAKLRGISLGVYR